MKLMLTLDMMRESRVLYNNGVAALLKILLTRAHACQSLRSDNCARIGGRTSEGKSSKANGDLKRVGFARRIIRIY